MGNLSQSGDIALLRLGKIMETVAAAYHLAFHNNLADFESCRMEVAAATRACVEAKGGKVDDIFDAISRDSTVITRDDIVEYLKKQSCTLDVAKVDRVCAVYVAGGLETGIPSQEPANKKDEVEKIEDGDSETKADSKDGDAKDE